MTGEVEFQSTHAQSVRPAFQRTRIMLDLFQSTHAQSVRPVDFDNTCVVAGFNPRTRRACDCRPIPDVCNL